MSDARPEALVPTLYRRIRPWLFRADPEVAHHRALDAARIGGEALAAAAGIGIRLAPPSSPRLSQRLAGIDFPNPIGLAAGFDKNGVAAHLWPALGFGFAELGTVTTLGQAGNPTPRLFRLPEDEALVNRLGFNNQGVEIVARRLERSLRTRPAIPIGLNIGASRVHVGDAEKELADYRESTRRLGRLCDYLVINVSSPNTPGLRDLQEPGRLARLVETVQQQLVHLGLGISIPPVFVKLSPDLPDEGIPPICAAALAAGAAGFIATNTTLSRVGLRGEAKGEQGGLSGAPLRERSNEVIARIRFLVGPDVPIIGIGGVSRLADVVDKFRAGADLVGLYSALVYEGPLLARRLALDLDRELRARGLASVRDLIGNGERAVHASN